MIINELKSSIRRNPIYFFSIIIYLFIILICLEFLFVNLFNVYNLSGNTFNNVKDTKYKLVDTADAVVSNIISDYYKVNDLKKFYNELVNNDNYIYYENINQPTYFGDFKGNDIFLDGYEYGETDPPYSDNSKVFHAVKQILINYNTMKEINIDERINEGNAFSEKDFFLKDYEKIPVILGYDYSKYYRIGDIIDGISKQDITCSYKVIGFLKKDTNTILNGELIYLDRYVVSPSITIDRAPLNYDELTYQGFFYLQKLNGTIELRNNYSFKEFLFEFENLRLKYNIFEFKIINYSIVQVNLLKFLVYENVKTLTFVFLLTLIFSVITMVIYILYKIKLNMYIYKVYLLCGYGIADIKRMVYFEILVPFSVALIISLMFLNVIMGEIFVLSVLFVLLIFLLILIATIFIVHNYFFNTTIEQFTMGEEND